MKESLISKSLAVVIILLFIGMSVIPSTGTNIVEKSTLSFDGNTLYVGGSGPGNYTKIQDAIDDVQLYIKGRIGIHMIVTKPANMSLTGNYTIYGQGIILKGKYYNETGNFIIPESIIELEIVRALGYVFLPITVTLNAGSKSISKSGFTCMWITFLR